MKKVIKDATILGIMIIVATILGVTMTNANKESEDVVASVVSSKLKKQLESTGTHVNQDIIRKVIHYSRFYAPREFPNGPFTAKDLVAIALVETEFSQFAIGANGERGVFQIYDFKNELKEMKIPEQNIFDLDINTRVVCHELKKKYKKRPDYYEAIIAYNGWYPDQNGKPKEHYWKKFTKAREFIEGIWPDS